MNLGRALASFVRDQRIFETAMIETNRLGRLWKQVDDRGTAEAEGVFVDDEVFLRPAVEEQEHVKLACFVVRHEVEQRVRLFAPIGVALVETEIKEEILFRKC